MTLDDKTLSEWEQRATEGYQPRGNRAVWAQRCASVIAEVRARGKRADHWRDAATNARMEREQVAKALADLRAAVAALAEANDVRLARSGAASYTGIGSDAIRALLDDPAQALAAHLTAQREQIARAIEAASHRWHPEVRRGFEKAAAIARETPTEGNPLPTGGWR